MPERTDTERLDWLERYKLLEGGYIVEAGEWVVQYDEGRGSTLREAIDDAMDREAAHDDEDGI